MFAALNLTVTIFFWGGFGPHPAALRGYYWLCAHKSLLADSPYGMLKINPRLAAYKANILPAVLLLRPHYYFPLADEKT